MSSPGQGEVAKGWMGSAGAACLHAGVLGQRCKSCLHMSLILLKVVSESF